MGFKITRLPVLMFSLFFSGAIMAPMAASASESSQISSSKGAYTTVDEPVTAVTTQKEGGDTSTVQSELKNIIKIFSTKDAFAALRSNGTVVTWGNPNNGSDSSDAQSELKNITAIFAGPDAFAALRSDGTVVTWGRKESSTLNILW